MSTIVFDTLKLSHKLIEAGFTREQADGAAKAIAESFGDEIVTKKHLDMRLAELKTDLLKWVSGLLLAQAAVVATLVKLL